MPSPVTPGAHHAMDRFDTEPDVVLEAQQILESAQYQKYTIIDEDSEDAEQITPGAEEPPPHVSDQTRGRPRSRSPRASRDSSSVSDFREGIAR